MNFQKHLVNLYQYINSHEVLYSSLICGIAIIDPVSNRIAYINKTAEQIFDQKKETIIGDDWMGWVGKASISKYGKEEQTDFCEELSNGKKIKRELSEVVIDGKLWRIESFVDVSGYHAKHMELEYLGYHDALTGLYNRNYIYKEIVAKKKFYGNLIGVMVIDVDGLKRINDLLGHAAGDEIIQRTAGILKCNVDNESVAARIGGDEFLVLTKTNDLLYMADIKQKILQHKEILNEIMKPELDISIGFSWGTVKGETDLHELYKMADANMYQEKRK